MATGAVPASFSGLQMKEAGLGFGKNMGFVRICDLKRIKSGRKKISMIRNSNTGPEIVELQPASEGSPLLGTQNKPCHILLFLFLNLGSLLVLLFI